jgi:signal transduction histidine kinase
VPIELCVSRAKIPGAAQPMFVGIIRDMSAYAAAERSYNEDRIRSQQLLAEQTSALQAAHLRLRMADRMASIGTLAAGLGHDMNNVLLPVRARLNALKAAADTGQIPGPQRKHIEGIRKSIAYLQQLADGLHFLALDPETREDQRAGGPSTDLHRWWSQAGPLLSKAVPKHVRVIASFPPHLPLVAIPAHGLTQAVLNLVVNAGEAIPPPPERKRRQGYVRLWADAPESSGPPNIRLSVADNGSGMSDEVRRRAFEMFYTTKPRGLGTGLGLALVRNVIAKAGGTIDIASEVGKGTTVTMSLPAEQPPNLSRRNPEPPEAAVSIADGRAAALVRHVLAGSGARVRTDQSPAGAEIWIADPASATPNDVKTWRRKHPRGRFVLLGKPAPRSAEAWSRLSPLTIDNPQDFESVRAVLGRALTLE